ncbi:hypothetical protein BESB_055110 [Besnoitia besnoiti]|uniref:CS domain-containing protein n=1 Tax=Besnoitia besnoiti TaxID=94643 RepID=A0A2A9MKA6_BESBE|nr:hypothetical protein BESB_055110 [Besnoitia besnoiti]PFH35860.1 hypothetical protein BESB_055110 [Besnoitia besnoiti]
MTAAAGARRDLHPQVKWGQDSQRLFVTFEFINAHGGGSTGAGSSADAPSCNRESGGSACADRAESFVSGDTVLSFRAPPYALDLPLFDSVDPATLRSQPQPPNRLLVTLEKKTPRTWPQLVKRDAVERLKPFIRVDWTRWSDDASDDTSEGEHADHACSSTAATEMRNYVGGSQTVAIECESGDVGVPFSPGDALSLDGVAPVLSVATLSEACRFFRNSPAESESRADSSNSRTSGSPTRMTPAQRMLTLAQLWNASSTAERAQFLSRLVETASGNAPAEMGQTAGPTAAAHTTLASKLSAAIKGGPEVLRDLSPAPYTSRGVTFCERWVDDLQKMNSSDKADCLQALVGGLPEDEVSLILSTFV